MSKYTLIQIQGNQQTELTALDAKIDAQHQKLVTSTLARVQKEAVIRKNLEQHQHKVRLARHRAQPRIAELGDLVAEAGDQFRRGRRINCRSLSGGSPHTD